MEALDRNGTLVITELLVERKPIGSKWVFKVKYKSTSEVERFKARCILSIVVYHNWPIYQLDNNNAFLYGDLVEGMYMSLPDSQFIHAPLQSHLKPAFRVLRYLKDAPGKGISFNKGDELNLSVYMDSDWAKCKVTRKSVTGYVIFIGKNLISWKSDKQSMLSKSSAKAEYRAINSVTCEVMWILKILAEMKIDVSLPDPMHCDHSSAIQIATNHVFHDKTKHFEIKLFFLKEKVVDGVVKTVKVKSVDNTAHIFTKGLSV
ncbi:ribonuclease H-like domain-containing protein [Tanacetum coccineum]